jgi:hypothetical protein
MTTDHEMTSADHVIATSTSAVARKAEQLLHTYDVAYQHIYHLLPDCGDCLRVRVW